MGVERCDAPNHEKDHNQVILSALFGMIKGPSQRLSDLQLGDQKITLNHLNIEY